MRLLKNDTPFVWDDLAQLAFDTLKHAITHAPMLQPLDYTKDYSLYVPESLTTIGMVLVKTNENNQEHVIYYLSKSLLDSETHYSCVEKLDLDTVIVVQKFHHHILLCTIIVFTNQNPMYYILPRQVQGGKYSLCIVILQEFDLEFTKANSKNSLVFEEFMCDLPYAIMEAEPNDSFSDEFLFLISTTDTGYGYLIICLHTHRFQPNMSHDNCRCIHHHMKYYIILNNMLY